jgi:hypothetical protein
MGNLQWREVEGERKEGRKEVRKEGRKEGRRTNREKDPIQY